MAGERENNGGGEVAVTMDKTLDIILKATLVVVLGSMVSCGDKKPPASQTQVVSKKINVAQDKATPAGKTIAKKGAAEAKPEVLPKASKAMEKTTEKSVVANASQKDGATVSVQPDASNPGAAVPPVTSDLIKASLEIVSSYDAAGRFDPFEPLFSDEPEAPVVLTGTGKKKKRAPQTPLEKVSLSQLKLTAIMRMPQGNRALVEDATGKGYVVKKGTYMGLNAGQVIKIEKDSLMVEEEIQNMVGEYIINNTELKLQKTAGDQ